MSDCPHDLVWGMLCAACGADVTASSAPRGDQKAEAPELLSVVHGSSELKVTASKANAMHTSKVAELLSARKLILVLDLDQTLIHATTSKELSHVATTLNQTVSYDREANLYEFMLPSTPDLIYYIKLRPYLREFLRLMHRHFECHVYTHGTRDYAEAVVRIIDSTREIFKGRVLSRTDCGGSSVKDMRRLFPVDDRNVVILDDRVDVWEFASNVIQVKPFRFFRVAHEVNALPQDSEDAEEKEAGLELSGLSPSPVSVVEGAKVEDEEEVDAVLELEAIIHGDQGPSETEELVERSPDRELEHLTKLVHGIKEEWFRQYDVKKPKMPDTKDIMAKIRQRVFRGCTLVFSSMFPAEVPAGQENKRRTEVLRLCSTFGATWQKDVVQEGSNVPASHVVAAKDKTDKVARAGQTRGVALVNSNWFYDSVFQYKRQDERAYPIESRPVYPFGGHAHGCPHIDADTVTDTASCGLKCRVEPDYDSESSSASDSAEDDWEIDEPLLKRPKTEEPPPTQNDNGDDDDGSDGFDAEAMALEMEAELMADTI